MENSEIASLKNRVSELETQLANCQRYKEIVNNANSIIMIMDTKGKITFFNPYAQRFFGFHENEILGKSVIGTIVSEKNITGQDLANMIEDIMANPESHSVNENENMRSNGDRVRVLWTNKAIISSNGNIKEILCVGNKVSK